MGADRASKLVETVCALGHRLRIGRWPDLDAPRAFNEKIQAFKLRRHDPALVPLVDKIAAKGHVRGMLGDDWVIETLYAGTELPAMRDWPLPYVVKANNSSGRNLFVRDAAGEDWDAVRRTARRWMTTRHAVFKGEWLYSQVAPRVLVEPLLGGPALPPDLKFFVFDGRVALIQVDTDRDSGHKRKLFDRDWIEQHATLHYPRDPKPFPRPAAFDAMVAAAETLGASFAFVRVDFYEIDGQPKFGELTFTPGAGVERFTPDAFDFKLGALWPWPAKS